MLLSSLFSFASAAPLHVDVGAHLDANHSQGFGLSRVGVGLDATVRNRWFGVEVSGWQALRQRSEFDPVDFNAGNDPTFIETPLDPFPRRGGALSAVWTPLMGDVAGVPLAIDLSSGIAVVHEGGGRRIYAPRGPWSGPVRNARWPGFDEVGFERSGAVAAALIGGGLRMSTGRAGSLRLCVRSTMRVGKKPQYDLTRPVTQSKLYAQATPSVGWVVRL